MTTKDSLRLKKGPFSKVEEGDEMYQMLLETFEADQE